MKEYSLEEQKEIVESFFDSEELLKQIKEDCGWPIKITVDWNIRHINIRGPKSGRCLLIDDILQAQHEAELH